MQAHLAGYTVAILDLELPARLIRFRTSVMGSSPAAAEIEQWPYPAESGGLVKRA
jgi:hypothetical protein